MIRPVHPIHTGDDIRGDPRSRFARTTGYTYLTKNKSRTHTGREKRTHSGLVLALERIYRSTRYIVRSEGRMRSALPYRIVRREVPLAWITE